MVKDSENESMVLTKCDNGDEEEAVEVEGGKTRAMGGNFGE